MSEQTKIQWCDSTINFWEGCTKVSAGCANCYAAERDWRFHVGKHWGKGAPRRKSKSAVKLALALNRKPWICDDCGHATDCGEWRGSPGDECPKCMKKRGHTRRTFSLSLGDWLDPEVPIEWLAEMLDTIRQCSDVQWILCSKRLENFTARMEKVYSHPQTLPPLMDFIGGWIGRHTGPLAKGVPKNVLLLASVENQEAADKRIQELLKIPAAKRGLSMEPLLGPVDISSGTYGSNGRGQVWDAFGKNAHCPNGEKPMDGPGINWLIIGGESGLNARPCNVDWIRSIAKQGRDAGCPVFVKQLGADPYYTDQYNGTDYRIHLTDKKGGDPSEWPADLRVQEWPKL